MQPKQRDPPAAFLEGFSPKEELEHLAGSLTPLSGHARLKPTCQLTSPGQALAKMGNLGVTCPCKCQKK